MLVGRRIQHRVRSMAAPNFPLRVRLALIRTVKRLAYQEGCSANAMIEQLLTEAIHARGNRIR